MIKPFNLSEQLKFIKFCLAFFFVWSITMTVLVFVLISGGNQDLKNWEKQLKIDKKFSNFIDYQNGFNERVDNLVIINLR